MDIITRANLNMVKIREAKIAKANRRTIAMGIVIAFTFIGATLVNAATMQKANKVARAAYVLETELQRLEEENTSLESIKAETLNIREIQRKALELGFVYNNDINYVK